MKNKNFISILIIIIFVLIAKNLHAEDFYFETPEIQTFNEGNLLKANKGGKALTEDNVEIIADKFQYNKITSLLTAKKNVIIVDPINKIVLKANKVLYLKNKEIISTIGKTEILIENKYLIKSSNINYERNSKLISSKEFTTLNDDKENFYSSEGFKYNSLNKLFRGKKITAITKEKDEYIINHGIINLNTSELQGKDLEVKFHKEMFDNPENEPRLKGNTVYSDQNVTKVSKGIFTTCKKRDGKCPPWMIKSKKVKHDKLKKTIYYKNAWLKVYDVPIMYYPFFFHPDPTVKRQSGFLKPYVGDSEILGPSAYIPYFYVISDSKDLTFKPRFFDDKYTIQSEYRFVTEKSENIFDVSLTKGHNSSYLDKNNSRGHFFSNSVFDIDFANFDKTKLEIQFQKTNNDTYLSLFDLVGDSAMIPFTADKLVSFINFNTYDEDVNFNTSLSVTEKLGPAESDRYQFVFPSYSFNKDIDADHYNLNGSLSFNSAGSQNLYDTNISEARIINDLNYKSEDKFLNNGIKHGYNLLLKNVNTKGSNSTKYKNKAEAEALTSIIFNSSYPLLREGINYNNYFTPKISARYSPTNMKNLRSENRRMGIGNIWSNNRIGSSDTLENGQSITIGTEYKKTKIVSKNIKEEDLTIGEKNYAEVKDVLTFDLATVFRNEINNNISKSSTLGNKTSDIFGNIRISPNEILTTSYSFNIDNGFNRLKYNQVGLGINVNNFITNFNYVEENDEIGNAKYINNNTSYQFNENSSIQFSTRRNKEISLTEFYDLIYQYKNDCLTAALQYKKKYYANSDIRPTEELFFSLTIIPVWAYESSNVLTKGKK